MSGPVLHVSRFYGLPSEPFTEDTITATEHCGWPAWVATLEVRGSYYSAPPRDRILEAVGQTRSQRVVDALTLDQRRYLRTADDWIRRLSVRPVLVHAHFGWAIPLAAPVASAFTVPLVATFHGSDVTIFPHYRGFERLPARLMGRGTRYDGLWGSLAHAFVVSSYLRDKVRSLGYAGECTVLPGIVHLDEFPFQATRDPGPRSLLFTGRLVHRKGVGELIRAMRHVVDVDPGARLTIIGDGPDRPQFETLSAELRLSGSVRFQGALAREAVSDWMRRANILVSPSQVLAGDVGEGGPLITKEGFASGIAVVATASGGTRETFPPEFRDELVAPGDPTALAEQILAVPYAGAEAQRRARLARSWIEERFDARQLGPSTAAVYTRLTT